MQIITSDKAPKSSFSLTWTDIKNTEGVYAPSRWPDTRIIVVQKYGEDATILFVGHNRLENAMVGSWQYEKFMKVDNSITILF